MRYLSFFLAIFGCINLFGQKEYDESSVRSQLEKYMENPKLYYDKIKSLNERAEKANDNTLKVSEEYLSLLDKKDSLIKIYKQKADKATRMAASNVRPNTAVNSTVEQNPNTTVINPQQTTTIVTKVQGNKDFTPFRVQLAAYFREDFEKFFGTFNKTLGITKLDNRNVIEVQGFKDENEAYEFSKKIQQLGFPGAFVTKYDENGARQEGYTTTDTKFVSTSSHNSNSNSVSYPDYIPQGYKEIKGNTESAKINPTPQKMAASTPAPPKSTPTPKVSASSEPPNAKDAPVFKLRAPRVSNKSVITDAQSISKPKNIASAAPISRPEQKAAQPPIEPQAASTNSAPVSSPQPKTVPVRDQLDAAFDQLFKK